MTKRDKQHARTQRALSVAGQLPRPIEWSRHNRQTRLRGAPARAAGLLDQYLRQGARAWLETEEDPVTLRCD